MKEFVRAAVAALSWERRVEARLAREKGDDEVEEDDGEPVSLHFE